MPLLVLTAAAGFTAAAYPRGRTRLRASSNPVHGLIKPVGKSPSASLDEGGGGGAPTTSNAQQGVLGALYPELSPDYPSHAESAPAVPAKPPLAEGETELDPTVTTLLLGQGASATQQSTTEGNTTTTTTTAYIPGADPMTSTRTAQTFDTPDGGHQVYGYDSRGVLDTITTTGADGVVRTYTPARDGDGNIIPNSFTYTDSNGITYGLATTFDSNGDLVTAFEEATLTMSSYGQSNGQTELTNTDTLDEGRALATTEEAQALVLAPLLAEGGLARAGTWLGKLLIGEGRSGGGKGEKSSEGRSERGGGNSDRGAENRSGSGDKGGTRSQEGGPDRGDTPNRPSGEQPNAPDELPKEQQYSGDLQKVNKPDAGADKLAERIGGQSRMKFSNDPDGREFDVVSDEFIGQAKPGGQQLGSAFRNQGKESFEAAQATGRKVYYHFDSEPGPGVINKLYEYSARYGVEVVIDTTPF
ncbi:restriction endonuclease fold toxin [Nocardia brasiliensis]|uniref:restriction endonuclease fold toxin n=1 Tax=Nocardia brasiliensis TaxID=37326 RepID=UPI00245487B4|nr:restriction endonuclease fold toxin [Nocardia brasiliensis]